MVQIGIAKYEREKIRCIDFSNIEYKKIQRYINYPQYGIYGFRMILKSRPISALFFNSNPFNELVGYIDNGVRIDNYESKTSPKIYIKATGGFIDFSWIMTILGSLVISTWGLFTFRDVEHIENLKNFTSLKKVRIGIIFLRSIFVLMFFVFIGITIYVQYFLNGISLSTKEIIGIIIYLSLLFFTLLFFLIISSLFGKIKKLFIACITVGILWVLFAFLLPELLSICFTFKIEDSMKSEYNHELNKTEILMDFEKEAYTVSKRHETKSEKIESDKKYLEKYKKTEFPILINLEKSRLNKVRDQVRDLHFWASIFPVTFLKSITNEISSRGYQAYLDFYNKNRVLQADFFIFYSDHVYSDSYGKVTPFLQKGENVITSQVKVPNYFLLGFLILVLYIMVFFFLSVVDIDVSSSRYHLPKDVDTELMKGKLNYFLTKDNMLKRALLNHFTDYWYLPNLSKIGLSFEWSDIFNTALSSGKSILIGSGFLDGLKKEDIFSIKENLNKKNITFLEIGWNEHQYYQYVDKKIKWINDTTIDHGGYSDCFDSDFALRRPTKSELNI
jgi:hypothetical protein